MSEALKGVLAMIAACIVWGLSGMYYKLLEHIPPLEVLSHRTIWSFVFFGIVLLFQRRLPQIISTLKNRQLVLMLAFSAIMISANWFTFILSIQKGLAMESSLGYYIFPLVAVVLGYFVLGERFSTVKIIAILIAFVAVVTLGIGLGNPPWISLILALTFGAYGLLKKQMSIGPVISVFIEVLLLAPIALIWLIGVHNFGWSGQVGVFGTSWRDSVLLMLSGILTGGPLILMSYAARRISLSTLGLVQYLNPTLQFLVATFVFMEPFTKWHAIAFPLIWLGLLIYSLENWRQEKSARKRDITVGTSSTT